MFGTYQQSTLRIELDASAKRISDSLTMTQELKHWLWPQQVEVSTHQLSEGDKFSSSLGLDTPLSRVNHQVEIVSPTGIRFVLSGSIDGFHEWQWGDGWVQSRLEGVSLLPLNLGQTLSLLKLKQHVTKPTEGQQ